MATSDQAAARARPRYTFGRYILPSLLVTVPMLVFWVVRGPKFGLVGVALGLTALYLTSGTVVWFMGEYHDWRRKRAEHRRRIYGPPSAP